MYTVSDDLSLQTKSAFERIKESLLGKTDDAFDLVVVEIDNLTSMYNDIQKVTFEVNNIDNIDGR